MRRLCTVLGCALLVVALAAPAARGELVAAYEHAGAGGDLDIAVVVALTGEPITLPAGVNTAADEFHPSLSGDGRYLVFEPEGTPPRIARLVETEAYLVLSLLTPTDVFTEGVHRLKNRAATSFPSGSATPPSTTT